MARSVSVLTGAATDPVVVFCINCLLASNNSLASLRFPSEAIDNACPNQGSTFPKSFTKTSKSLPSKFSTKYCDNCTHCSVLKLVTCSLSCARSAGLKNVFGCANPMSNAAVRACSLNKSICSGLVRSSSTRSMSLSRKSNPIGSPSGLRAASFNASSASSAFMRNVLSRSP